MTKETVSVVSVNIGFYFAFPSFGLFFLISLIETVKLILWSCWMLITIFTVPCY